MYGEYISLLNEALSKTKIYFSENKCISIEQGFTELVEFFLTVRNEKKRVFFIGNGGSAGIAIHMTADYMKNGKMETHSIYDSAVFTCMGNDYGYEYVFSKQIEMIGNEADLLVVISSSGNSPNVIKAIEMARVKKIKVITFTGFKEDNQAKNMGDYNIHVPISHYGIVESIHNLLLQQIVDVLMEKE